MNYRKMGRTGLKISSVSIGGWLTLGGSVDAERSARILRRAVEGGVNFIDLADVYSAGAAEEVAGAAVRGLDRASLVLSSKVFGRMGDGPNQRGLSRKHIIESCEASLRRIGTDYLDLYFCHRSDPETPLEETVRAMDDLVHQGKVHYWGTSVWQADLLDGAHDLCDRRGFYPPLVEQPPYRSPFPSSIRRVIVSCPFSAGSSGSRSRSTHADFLASRSETSTVSSPCSSANHLAPSPTSMTWRELSMTRLAAVIGWTMPSMPPTLPAPRLGPSMMQASSCG